MSSFNAQRNTCYLDHWPLNGISLIFDKVEILDLERIHVLFPKQIAPPTNVCT